MNQGGPAQWPIYLARCTPASIRTYNIYNLTFLVSEDSEFLGERALKKPLKQLENMNFS